MGIAIAISMFLPVLSSAEKLKTFSLTVGSRTIQIEPGETAEIAAPDGSKTAVTLQRNEFATYESDSFAFNFPTRFNVVRSDVGDNIVQHLMASALGTLVIVQEYKALNPSPLVELMMQELTRETVAAGGVRVDEPVEHTIASGQVLKGLRSAVTIDGDTAFYEVLPFGSGNSGIIAVTRIDEERLPTEGAMLSTFWSSLEMK